MIIMIKPLEKNAILKTRERPFILLLFPSSQFHKVEIRMVHLGLELLTSKYPSFFKSHDS
jgi:hypothetical protein